jgi:hypothetical protein
MSIKQTGAVALAAAHLFTNTACAEPNKVLHELQERCGNQAANTFKNELGENITKTSQGTTIANYENHISAFISKSRRSFPRRTIGR